MTIEQIIKKLQENEMYLEMFADEEKYEALRQAFHDDSEKLRGMASQMGHFII